MVSSPGAGASVVTIRRMLGEAADCTAGANSASAMTKIALPSSRMWPISRGLRRQFTGMQTAPILHAARVSATQSAVCRVRQATRSPLPTPRLASPCAMRLDWRSRSAKVQVREGAQKAAFSGRSHACRRIAPSTVSGIPVLPCALVFGRRAFEGTRPSPFAGHQYWRPPYPASVSRAQGAGRARLRNERPPHQGLHPASICWRFCATAFQASGGWVAHQVR